MRKRILALLLAFVMAVGLLPTAALAAEAPSGYTSDSNGIMAYKQSDTTIDVKGNYKGTWIQTTYSNAGYQIEREGLDAADVTAETAFINDGKYIKLSYTVTAGSESVTGGKLAVHADVQIGSNDYAEVEVIQNPATGEVIGLKMVDDDTDYSSYNAQFNLYFGGTGGVTPVDTYWFGHYSSRRYHYFDNLSDSTLSGYDSAYTKDTNGAYTKFTGKDSGMAVSWQNIDLEPGESKTYSFILGVGEKAEPPSWGENGNRSPVTLTLSSDIQSGQNDRLVNVAAKVQDALGQTDTLYYSVDGGSETAVGSVEADGESVKKITGQLDLSGYENGTYQFTFWVVNTAGAVSPSVTREITISDTGITGLDHAHSWAGGWETNETHHWHECTAADCDVTENSDKDGYGEHAEDEGTVAIQPTKADEGTKEYKCTACGRVLRTEAIPALGFDISGTVQGGDDQRILSATVRLVRGKSEIASTATDSDGNYSFTRINPGYYNIVATTDDVTMTQMVIVTDDDLTRVLIMPGGSVNSVLKVEGEDTPDVVVGGLDAEAAAEAEKAENSTAASVTVTMTVESRKENADNTAQTAIKDVITGGTGTAKKIDFLEIKVEKTLNTDAPEGVTDTEKLLTLVVPYNFTGKTDVKVYRYHGGAAGEMTENPDSGNEGYELDVDNGLITIYAQKFSTYAICYTEVTYTVTFDSQDGSAVDSQTVVHGGKAAEPDVPIRTGYTFGGWYKEADCTNAWDFDADTVTGNVTLYAKWTLNRYEVTFNSQGGTAVDSQTVDHGGKATEPAVPPTKSGYTFGGWYKEADCTNAWDFDTDTVTGNVTLYAKWAENTYTVSGTVTDNTGTAVAGAMVKLMQNGTQVGETVTTEPDGQYSFTGVKPGEYDIVITKDGVTTTMKVTVTDSDLADQTQTMPHAHKWATAWSKDATHHWHECGGTGTCDVTATADKNGYGAHTPGDWIIDQEATVEAAGSKHKECTVCGYIMETDTIPKLHSHTWATVWTNNATHHWHECTADGCTVTENSGKDGYGAHTPGDWIIDQEATTEAAGSKHKECTVCGYIMETDTIPKLHSHVWATVWTNNATHHWHECTADGCTVTENSGKDGYGAHTPGDWVIDQEATTEAEGRKHKECTVCGYIMETDSIPKLHSHVWATVWTNNATHHWHECTANGCTVTENSGKDGYGAHTPGDWVIDQEATTEAEGRKHKECTVCGYIMETDSIPKLHSHAWATDWTTDETNHWHECTADSCTVTENSGKDGYGAHTPGDWVIDQEATTAAAGSKHKECTVCGYVTETGTIPRLEPSHTHNWATDWTTDETHHWHECTADGCTVTENSGKDGYGAHTPGDWIIDQEATTGAAGSKHKECTICGYVTETETIPILAFDISGTVTDNDNAAVEGATVRLKQGKSEIASTTTDSDGNYSFTNVAPGSYNIVAEQTKDGSVKTMTILVTVTNASLSDQNLKMPSDNVNSVLEVKGDDTPAVVVGGLEKEAEANKEENGTVTVTMTVESKEENNAANAAEIKAAAGEGKKLEYLEIKVEKTIEAEDSSTTDPISTTINLLTIVIPFDFTGKVQSSVAVYRYHGGGVDTLTTTASGSGERIELGTDSITLYVRNFSTYAIGYTEDVETYTVTFDSQGGSAVASQNVAKNGKVTEPADPTKSGYSFDGWYKEAACATAWDFSADTVTGDMTLYAKWTRDTDIGYDPPTYPINVQDNIPDGTVSVSHKSAGSGTTVTITVTPDEGYEISSVTVIDKDGKEVPVTGKGKGKYTFTMPARKVTVSASFTRIREDYADCPKDDTCPIWPYTDASVTAWYHDGVHYCIENSVMSGYGNYTFGPDDDTSRAMIAMILWRLEGSPVVNYILPFDDVAEGAWYTEAVRWAAASGVVNGYGNGKFGPGDPITREQLAAMLYRYEQYKGGGFTGAWMFPLNYADAELVSSWAYEPMCWTTMNEIIKGIGNGLLDPGGKVTRAQAATMIMRFCEKK